MTNMQEQLMELLIAAKRDDPETGSFTEFLVDYLIQHGVILLPCSVGTTVYGIATPCGGCEHYRDTLEETLANCRCCAKKEIITFDFGYDCIPEYGKTIFLTREEAEQALERSRESNA